MRTGRLLLTEQLDGEESAGAGEGFARGVRRGFCHVRGAGGGACLFVVHFEIWSMNNFLCYIKVQQLALMLPHAKVAAR